MKTHKIFSELLFVGIGLFAISVSAAKQKLPLLTDVLRPYRIAGQTKIEIEKKVTSELLGKTTTYVGTVYVAPGLIRWENDTPEKSLLLYDGKVIWSVQYPSEDFPGPIQIAQSKIDKKNKQQIVLSQLLTKVGVEKNFSILSESESDLRKFILKPKDIGAQIQELVVYFDPSKKQIVRIQYFDEVQNKTEIFFVKIRHEKKKDTKLFKYEPPNKAKVTYL